jgi:NADH-quinone oxidoreductase subunit F
MVRRYRPPNNTGTKLFCISGHVNKPCTVEEAMSIPFRELIDKHCGGIRGGWDNLKAVIPGGSSVPACRPTDHRHADGFRHACATLKSGLGTAAVIVMDKSTDHHQGDCPARLLLQARDLRPVHAVPRRHRLDVARAGHAWRRPKPRSDEIDMLLDVTKQIEGHTICALGDAAAWPIQGLIRHFRPEIEDRINQYRLPRAMVQGAVVAAE